MLYFCTAIEKIINRIFIHLLVDIYEVLSNYPKQVLAVRIGGVYFTLSGLEQPQESLQNISFLVKKFANNTIKKPKQLF